MDNFTNKLIVGRTSDDTIGDIQAEGFITGLDCPLTSNSAVTTSYFDTFKKSRSFIFSTSAPINPDNNPTSTVWVQYTGNNPKSIVSVYQYINGMWDIKKIRNVGGAIIEYAHPENFTLDDGTHFFKYYVGVGLDITRPLHIYNFNAWIGTGVHHSLPESSKIPLDIASFDLFLYHYSWPYDRANTIIRMYDINNTYLGQFYYVKTMSNWSRDDYSDIFFYNATGTKILDISAADISGTSYGNGAIQGSFILTDPSKITFQPADLNGTPGLSGATRNYPISHLFSSTRFITFEVLDLYNTYTGINVSFVQVGDKESLFVAR
jgi:hypothetical protein